MQIPEEVLQYLGIRAGRRRAHIEIAGPERRAVEHGGKATHHHKIKVSVALALQQVIEVAHEADGRPVRIRGRGPARFDAAGRAGRKRRSGWPREGSSRCRPGRRFR